jgi:hypothetical protein
VSTAHSHPRCAGVLQGDMQCDDMARELWAALRAIFATFNHPAGPGRFLSPRSFTARPGGRASPVASALTCATVSPARCRAPASVPPMLTLARIAAVPAHVQSLESPSVAGRIAKPVREPGADAFQDIDLVGSLGEAMVLVRVDHQLVLGAELGDRSVEVHRLTDGKTISIPVDARRAFAGTITRQ